MSFVYNAALLAISRGGASPTLDWVAETTIECLLLSGSHTPDKDHVYVSDLSNELNGTGYVSGYGGSGRHAIGSRAITKDNTNDLVKFTAAAPSTWAAINAGTARYLIVACKRTSDSDGLLVACIDINPSAGITFDGNDWAATWPANGVFYLKAA
jgi:hypothetical protein